MEKIDSLLFLKIQSLESNFPRYFVTVSKYFDSLSKNETEKYLLVKYTIEHMWKDESNKGVSEFSLMKDFEGILQRKENYRDHLIHSMNVFLLGYYIINTLESDINNRLFRGDHNLTWLLASTFHDIGYPIERIDYWLSDILDTLLGMDPKISLNIGHYIPPIYNEFMKLISRTHLHPDSLPEGNLSFDWSFYSKLNEKLVSKDHGVFSGLILAHKLGIREGFIVSNNWNFSYNHLTACHAVCTHTMDVPLSFSSHPYAALLKVCDEIQDWGRPSLTNNNDIIELSEIQVDFEPRRQIIIEVVASSQRFEKLKEKVKNVFTGAVLTVEILNKSTGESFKLNDFQEN